jgi:hypothetical protein
MDELHELVARTPPSSELAFDRIQSTTELKNTNCFSLLLFIYFRSNLLVGIRNFYIFRGILRLVTGSWLTYGDYFHIRVKLSFAILF